MTSSIEHGSAKPTAPTAFRSLLEKGVDADSPAAVQIGRVLLGCILLGFWEYGSGRFLDPFYFSRPSLLLWQFVKEIGDAGFYVDLRVTAIEMVLGYGLGAVIGIAGGIVLGRYAYVARVLDPFLLALNSIPRIAVAPMLIVWFGIDIASKVFLSATLVFFITFFNTLSGIRGVEQALCNVARVQGASQWQIFTKVMLPSASSWILTGLRMSLPFALVGVILGEFLVASKGLGYRLNMYSTGYNTTGALTIVLVMMVLMMMLTAIMDRFEARILRWRPRTAEIASVMPKA